MNFFLNFSRTTTNMRLLSFVFYCCLCTQLNAQLLENFSDGDFTTNPTWIGTVADYQVNGNQQLQLNAAAAGTSYINTAHNLTDFNNKEWHFWVKQGFSGSANNNGRIYLTSTNADLSTDPDGIYIQMGESLSLDAVRLMQKNGGSTTQICASADGSISSSFEIGVRVVRDGSGNWSLYVDFTGGTSYVLVGTGVESAMATGAVFGYLNTYTSGNVSNFYFDDLYIGDEIVDLAPPIMDTVLIINNMQIDVVFNEALSIATAEDENNYDIIPFNSAATATLDGSNPKLVHIQLGQPLSNGNTYTITSSGIEDLNGNSATSQSLNFVYLIAEAVSPGDVIINEFFCDPTPTVGLPEAEFVEIYNKSTKILNVNNWQLGDASTFGTIKDGWLMPGAYLILCPTGNVPDYSGSVGVTSFPSLNNTEDSIVLKDENGVLLDLIYYSDSWYQDEAKEDGGWTIERINPLAPCSSASNWKASLDASGGTPAIQNSVFDTTPDTGTPFLTAAFVTNTNEVQLYFNELVDSFSIASASITTSPTLTETSRLINSQLVNQFSIQFTETITPSQIYSISLTNIQDCWGNVGTSNINFVLPDEVDSGDVIINEVLFDSYTGGSDWVEIYNNSDKIIDLKGWKIARIYQGEITDHEEITSHYLLYPKDYVVFDEDSNFTIANYPAAILGKFYQTDLPTYSDDTGGVVVTYPKFVFIDTMDFVMDQLVYADSWHFELLDENDGKSLERIDPNLPTQDKNNWHTAAEAIGFGTPGGENSQYTPALHNGEISLTSQTISPDNDGFEDVLQINYQMNQAGMLATIKIFDDYGRMIKLLSESELLGIKGTFTWDGVRDNGLKANIGTYVLLVEAFNATNGEKFVAKKVFVVAGKM